MYHHVLSLSARQDWGMSIRVMCSVFGVGLAGLVGISGCIHTEPFRDQDGRIRPRSVATMEMETIGGIPQSLWFRGMDVDNPALILLHGGPGVSESALFRYYDPLLEQHFSSGVLGAAWHRAVVSERPFLELYEHFPVCPRS
jgi:hypothetical protein